MAAPSPFVRAGWYTSLGINFSGTIVGGAIGGWLIDRWLDSAPWALIICTLLGVVAGFVSLIQGLKQLERRDHAGKP